MPLDQEQAEETHFSPFFEVPLLKYHDISRSVKISLAGQVQTCFEGLQSQGRI